MPAFRNFSHLHRSKNRHSSDLMFGRVVFPSANAFAGGVEPMGSIFGWPDGAMHRNGSVCTGAFRFNLLGRAAGLLFR
jgi:hypothetical protein